MASLFPGKLLIKYIYCRSENLRKRMWFLTAAHFCSTYSHSKTKLSIIPNTIQCPGFLLLYLISVFIFQIRSMLKLADNGFQWSLFNIKCFFLSLHLSFPQMDLLKEESFFLFPEPCTLLEIYICINTDYYLPTIQFL